MQHTSQTSVVDEEQVRPNLDFLVQLGKDQNDEKSFYSHYESIATHLRNGNIEDNQFSAWQVHLESLFGDNSSNPRFDYSNYWNYRYRDHVVFDMLTFIYNEKTLGLMKVNYRVDKRDKTPACIIGIVQGNEKEDEQALLSVKNLRENMLKAFLYTTQSLYRTGWQIGLVADSSYARLRDRFMKKEVHTFTEKIPDGSPSIGPRKYWKISPEKNRIREIMSTKKYQPNFVSALSPLENLGVSDWPGDEVWRLRGIGDEN